MATNPGVPARLTDVHVLMGELAQRRPLFHSEADFQFELAWQVRCQDPDAMVRLERHVLDAPIIRLDLQVNRVAIELKYKTKNQSLTCDGERFELRDHAARDHARYDFVKDVSRLERLIREGEADVGYAILLTSDRHLWARTENADPTNDMAFRIHEGERLQGTRAWDSRAGAGTIRSREEALALEGVYECAWRNDPGIGECEQLLQYLAIEVLPTL